MDPFDHCINGDRRVVEGRSADEDHVWVEVDQISSVSKGLRVVAARNGPRSFRVPIGDADYNHIVKTTQNGQVSIGGHPTRANDADG
jgi:hypothetical protein